MAGRLTTHALDQTRGVGAAGLRVDLRRIAPDEAALGSATLDDKGRAVLLESGLQPGVYELTFHAAAYHRSVGAALSDPPFLDLITIRIGVAADQDHYHVPLLLSPFGYSTYRGS